MATVRELVTRLAFQVDRRGIDQFNQTIKNFKHNIVATTGDITSAFQSVVAFFNQGIDRVFNTKNLAERSKVAVEEFAALRRAAESLFVDPKNFDNAFQKLSTDLANFSRGFGDAFEIIRKSEGEIQFNNINGQLKNTKELFFDILNYLRSFDDLSHAINVAESMGLSEDIARLAYQSRDAFLAAAEANKAYGQSFKDGIPEVLEYKKNLVGFNQTLDEFYTAFVINILPAVTEGINQLTNSFKGLGLIYKEFKEGGIGKALNFVGEAIAESVFDLFGFETVNNLQKKIAEEDIEFEQRKRAYLLANPQVAKNLNISNRVQINVPPGTNEQQATNMSEQLELMQQAFWDEKLRELISNNPQVE